MEDPEAMKLVIEQGVIASADKWALVLQAAGWSVVCRGGQTGLLQSPVQISQRVCLHPAVPSMAWQEGIINKDFIANELKEDIFPFLFLKQNKQLISSKFSNVLNWTNTLQRYKL